MIFKNCLLIGVGLMGSSLALDLKRYKIVGDVVGSDVNAGNLRFALRQKIITRAAKNLKIELERADLIILATPVLALVKQIAQIAPHVRDEALVIDLGSTKEKIVHAADRCFLSGNFVACHPMAGSEKSGPKAVVIDLIKGKPCLVTPGKVTKKKFITMAKELWRRVGAHVVVLDAQKHDRLVAACSHLPHVLAFAMLGGVTRGHDHKIIKKIAGASFKSYARIAGSDARMWADIFLDNRQNVLAEISHAQQILNTINTLIKSNDAPALFKLLTQISRSYTRYRAL